MLARASFPFFLEDFDFGDETEGSEDQIGVDYHTNLRIV